MQAGCGNKGISMKPVETVYEALQIIDSYDELPKEFILPISNSLQDPVGANMAIIVDKILSRGLMPDGYEQKKGYRLYKYIEME